MKVKRNFAHIFCTRGPPQRLDYICLCLSVCLSVTSRSSTKTAKRSITLTCYTWAGSRHSQSSVTVCRPSLQLGADTVTAQDDVRLLVVTISSDLSLRRHVSNVSFYTAFYWLRQLRRVRRSLDSESAATLVHAFVTSRVDQCNAIIAGATKSVTDTLQRVMNAAARVVSETRKFDRGLTQILQDDLHWLDVADRVTYKLGVIMHRCRHARLRSTLSTVAHRSPMLSAGSVSGQPHSN